MTNECNEKKCPRCAEFVKVEAEICHYCKFEFKQNNQESEKSYPNKGFPYVLVILIIIGICVTLPFHYIEGSSGLDGLKIFPKKSLTFSNTFISRTDLKNKIRQYNESSLYQRIALNQDPFIRALMDNNIIYEIQNSEIEK